ncbi:MAG: DUF3142 domain-containing protein, partial [Verrucomicrobia bacterium]|nr:DUF3142 domain-containing protein [Verrucomicrobiota bacterium]
MPLRSVLSPFRRLAVSPFRQFSSPRRPVAPSPSRLPLLALSAFSLLLTACERPPHTAGQLQQDVYVWQRVWTKEVDSVLPEAQAHFHELLPLAAEVSWKNSQPVVTQIAIDYPSLHEATHTIGLVLRINAYGGPFRSQDNATRELGDLGRTLITNAQHAGFTVTELQLDFDCAASKLPEYRVWVHALKEALSPTPVHITVLPTWIKKPGFAR